MTALRLMPALLPAAVWLASPAAAQEGGASVSPVEIAAESHRAPIPPRAEGAARRGAYVAALFHLEQALAVCTAPADQPDRCLDLLLRTADMAWRAGDSQRGKDLAQRALDLANATFGENHRDTAAAHYNLGLALHAQADEMEAMVHLTRANRIFEDVLGSDALETAFSYSAIGYVFDALGEPVPAEQNHTWAREIRVRILGEGDPLVAASHVDIGASLVAYGRPALAESRFRRALEIVEQTSAPDTLVARVYAGLGDSLFDLGRTAEAGIIYRRALTIRRRVRGELHQETAMSYDRVGASLQALGRSTDAEAYYRRALTIRRRVLGEGHRDVALSYYQIGRNVASQGRPEEATAWYLRALGVFLRALGEWHPLTADVYYALGDTLRIVGRLAEAEPYYVRAHYLSGRRQSVGRQDTVRRWLNLSSLWQSLGTHPHETYSVRRLALMTLVDSLEFARVGDDTAGIALKGFRGDFVRQVQSAWAAAHARSNAAAQ